MRCCSEYLTPLSAVDLCMPAPVSRNVGLVLRLDAPARVQHAGRQLGERLDPGVHERSVQRRIDEAAVILAPLPHRHPHEWTDANCFQHGVEEGCVA